MTKITDGRARVTTDEEWVLPEDWTEIRLVRLASCENFVGGWKEFIFNAFVDLEPVQRSEDGCDMRRLRSFNHTTCKTVLNLLEAVYLRFRNIVVERVSIVKFRVDNRDSDMYMYQRLHGLWNVDVGTPSCWRKSDAAWCTDFQWLQWQCRPTLWFFTGYFLVTDCKLIITFVHGQPLVLPLQHFSRFYGGKIVYNIGVYQSILWLRSQWERIFGLNNLNRPFPFFTYISAKAP